MRFGRNPFRTHNFPQRSAELTVATVVHVPFTAGYYKQSLDVFRLMLASLQAHTDVPYDLLVFDNASCAEVREFLWEQHQNGIIQYLVLSDENEGQLGAYNFMFGAARSKYIAYADCDIYFAPGWFRPHRQIVETFPNVGMVTGVPVRHRSHKSTAGTLEWARAAPDVQLEEGRLIDPEWIADYCEGIGWKPDQTQNLDTRLTLNGVVAYAGAYHFQFVLPKAAALQVLPLSTEHPFAVGELDRRIDAAGCLRLSTDGVYVHHLGNALIPRWEAEARRLGVSLKPGLGDRLRPIQRWRHRAVDNRFVRPMLTAVYDRVFELLTRKPA